MIARPVQLFIDDNDQLRPEFNMDFLNSCTPKQLLDIAKVNAEVAGLDIKKILIDAIVMIAKVADKQGTDNSPTDKL